MEITPEYTPSAVDENSSCSDSDAELLTTITTPSPVSRPTFRLLPTADQVVIRKKCTDRLPPGYARHHCPSVIQFRSRTPNFQTSIQNALFDAMLSSDDRNLNPMELLAEHTGDDYEISVLTKETLEYLLPLLNRPNCNARLLDGPYVRKNTHYTPAAAGK